MNIGFTYIGEFDRARASVTQRGNGIAAAGGIVIIGTAV